MGNHFAHTKNPSEDIPEKLYQQHLDEQETYVWPRAKPDPKYYRRNDARPDPRILSVWIKNPFSDVYDNTVNLQSHPVCGKIEMGMMNCLEAYGLPQGFDRCRDHMDDVLECLTENKRYLRVKAMRRERVRQYRQGEREIKYAMPPKPGSYQF